MPTAAHRPLSIAVLVLALVILGASSALSLIVPMDAQLLPEQWYREAYRTLFFHLPLAWAGSVMLLVAAVQGGRYLVTRDLRADRAALGAVELGLVLLVLATVTGMFFARSQWGAWWNWDPRETSILFVLLMYAAYLMLRGALPPDEGLRARLSAGYILLATAPMVWLVGIYPRTAAKAASMHPTQPPIHAEHWRVVFLAFAGLLLLCRSFWLLQRETTELTMARWEREQ